MLPSEFPEVGMTIRFEGLTVEQVHRLHEAVEACRTNILDVGGRVNLPGEGGACFTAILKSEMKSGGKYTVLLNVYTELVGWVYPPLPGKDRRWAAVCPSRNGLGRIFEAIGILPQKETVKDLSVPVSHGG